MCGIDLNYYVFILLKTGKNTITQKKKPPMTQDGAHKWLRPDYQTICCW